MATVIECRDCGKRQSAGRPGMRRRRCRKCKRPFVSIRWNGGALGVSGVNYRHVERGEQQEKLRHPSGGDSSGRQDHRRNGPRWYHEKDGVCRCVGLRFGQAAWR